MKLSVLIPAYNEAVRLPPYLRAIRKHFGGAKPLTPDGSPLSTGERGEDPAEGLDEWGRFAYELIVVDDGSTDGMASVLEKLFDGWAELRIVTHADNQGRAQAIRTGCAAARGDLVLYADADGATPIAEETKLRSAIDAGADIAIGSRVVRHGQASRLRALHRGFISWAFRMLAGALVTLPVRDTQCGFKMWRSGVATAVLPLCADKGWLLDVEVLAIAHRLGLAIAEVPVTWSEVAGSKVRLLRDSWRMFRGLWRIRRSVRRMEGAKQHAPIGVLAAKEP